MRKYIRRFQSWIEIKLRCLCGRITPEKRLAVLLSMFVIFGAASLYIFAHAIYEIGRNQEPKIEIKHIKSLNIKQNGAQREPGQE